MKKTNFGLFSLVVVLMMGLSMTSCNKDVDILGKWKIDKVIFTENGKVKEKDYSNKESFLEFTSDGTCIWDEDKLSYTLVGDKLTIKEGDLSIIGTVEVKDKKFEANMEWKENRESFLVTFFCTKK